MSQACSAARAHALCDHQWTRGRPGEKGSWCRDCGTKVFEVDDRECRGCEQAKQLFDGWICRRHLMAITPDMHVTFRLVDGSCWTERAVQTPALGGQVELP
jgi:hypothetical protein